MAVVILPVVVAVDFCRTTISVVVSCWHWCVGAQVGAVKEQVGAVKERIAGKSHELLNKWEEMSREFVTNFVELFGRDGRLNSWLRESGRKVRRAISPPPSELTDESPGSYSLRAESPGTSSDRSSPPSSPPAKRSRISHPDDWSDSDDDENFWLVGSSWLHNFTVIHFKIQLQHSDHDTWPWYLPTVNITLQCNFYSSYSIAVIPNTPWRRYTYFTALCKAYSYWTPFALLTYANTEIWVLLPDFCVSNSQNILLIHVLLQNCFTIFYVAAIYGIGSIVIDVCN